MEYVDKIICPRLVYLSEKDEFVKDCAIIISGNIIRDIVDKKTLKGKYKSEYIVNFPQDVFLPGFINSHYISGNYLTHYIMEKKKNHKIFSDKLYDEEYMELSTSLCLVKMMKSGITTNSDVSIFPKSIINIYQTCGIRLSFGLPILTHKTNWAIDENEYLKKCLEIYDEYKSYPDVTMFIALFVESMVDEKILKKISSIVNEVDLSIRLIIEGSGASKKQLNTIISNLEKHNIINSGYSCVSTDSNNLFTDMAIEKKYNIISTEIRSKQIHNSSIDQRTSLCIGNETFNKSLSPIRNIENNIIKLDKSHNKDKLISDIFSKMNLNSAVALNMKENIGSITPGKYADLISFKIEKKIYDNYEAKDIICFSDYSTRVRNVWIGGRQVMQDYKLITINENLLYDKIKKWIIKNNHELK